MKQLTLPTYVFYVLVIGVIVISSLFFFAMKDGGRCLGNPMVYGANKAVNEATGPIQCSCSFQSPSYAPFYFDTKGMSTVSPLAP